MHELAVFADSVAGCTKCRLAQGRTQVVFGSGHPDADLMLVGEAPGFHEDKQGVPFVGQAGKLLEKLLAGIGLRREDVYIANVLKCRPPDNRDPQPDEIAACAPFLRRQLEALDPAVVVTLGRYSMGTFLPGARIGQVHGTSTPADPETGARDALVFAMYHPAAALRTQALERESFDDIARVPTVLLRARERRAGAGEGTPAGAAPGEGVSAGVPVMASVAPGPAAAHVVEPAAAISVLPGAVEPAGDDADQLTLFTA